MTWHWRVSTGQLELTNLRPDQTIIYVHRGDQLPLRELDEIEWAATRSCRTDTVLPPPRIGKSVNAETPAVSA